MLTKWETDLLMINFSILAFEFFQHLVYVQIFVIYYVFIWFFFFMISLLQYSFPLYLHTFLSVFNLGVSFMSFTINFTSGFLIN